MRLCRLSGWQINCENIYLGQYWPEQGSKELVRVEEILIWISSRMGVVWYGSDKTGLNGGVVGRLHSEWMTDICTLKSKR